MVETSAVTPAMIEAAAAAIANARGGRRGAPAIRNILEILPQKLRDEVMEDAEEALKAALATRPSGSMAQDKEEKADADR